MFLGGEQIPMDEVHRLLTPEVMEELTPLGVLALVAYDDPVDDRYTHLWREAYEQIQEVPGFAEVLISAGHTELLDRIILMGQTRDAWLADMERQFRKADAPWWKRPFVR